MNRSRFAALCRLLLGLAAAVAWAASHAQGFPLPNKPIRIVLPVGSGTPPDSIARLVATRLSAQLGVATIVENKPGGGFVIGTMEVVRAAPDGHTLLFGSSSTVAMLPHTVAKLPFDAFGDLTPVIYITRVPLVLASSVAAPFSTFAEFVAQARANPGKFNFGTQAVNTVFDITFEQIKQAAGINVAVIPHKTTTELVQGLLSGEVQLGFLGGGQAASLRKAGKLRLIAVADRERMKILPDVPTFIDHGMPSVDLRGDFHLFGPAKMAPALVERVNAAWQAALKEPEVVQLCDTLGYPIVGGSAADSLAELRSQNERWGQVVRALGIRPQ